MDTKDKSKMPWQTPSHRKTNTLTCSFFLGAASFLPLLGGPYFHAPSTSMMVLRLSPARGLAPSRAWLNV